MTLPTSDMRAVDLPVNRTYIEALLANLIRDKQAFNAANRHLRFEHFMPEETIYATTWTCLQQYVRDYDDLPPQEALSVLVAGQLQGSPTTAPGELEDAETFIRWVYSDQPRLVTDMSLDMLHRVLQVRVVEQQLRSAVVNNPGRTLDRIEHIITEAQESLSRLRSIRHVDTPGILPDEFESDVGGELHPCGIDAFDVQMNGGMSPGEVNVLLAPTGVGKTLCSVQIVCHRGRMQYARELQEPGSGKLVVFIYFEEPATALRPRFMAAGAGIHITRAYGFRSLADMSTTGNLQEYEQQRYAQLLASGAVVLGERERYAQAQPWLNTLVDVPDFSCSRVNGVIRGAGGIPEIVSYLEDLQQRRRRQIDTVVIDWAGVCVRRLIESQSKGGKQRDLSTELGGFVDQVASKIAAKFKCMTWVTHQLAGEYQNKPVTFKFHHSHADWCKSFANFAWFAFVLGTKDRESSTCIVRTTKTRRGAGMAEAICHIDGAFGQLQTRTDMEIDTATGRLVSRDEAARFVESRGAPQRRHGFTI